MRSEVNVKRSICHSLSYDVRTPCPDWTSPQQRSGYAIATSQLNSGSRQTNDWIWCARISLSCCADEGEAENRAGLPSIRCSNW